MNRIISLIWRHQMSLQGRFGLDKVLKISFWFVNDTLFSPVEFVENTFEIFFRIPEIFLGKYFFSFFFKILGMSLSFSGYSSEFSPNHFQITSRHSWNSFPIFKEIPKNFDNSLSFCRIFEHSFAIIWALWKFLWGFKLGFRHCLGLGALYWVFGWNKSVTCSAEENGL